MKHRIALIPLLLFVCGCSALRGSTVQDFLKIPAVTCKVAKTLLPLLTDDEDAARWLDTICKTGEAASLLFSPWEATDRPLLEPRRGGRGVFLLSGGPRALEVSCYALQAACASPDVGLDVLAACEEFVFSLKQCRAGKPSVVDVLF